MNTAGAGHSRGTGVGDPERGIVPGRFNARFRRLFAWYGRRLFARRFYAVRMAHGGSRLLTECAGVPGLVVLALNHSSWWDPMIGFHLQDRFLSTRTPCSPIDAAQLAKFAFFRKLGMFGVDPDDAGSLRAMAQYVGERRERDHQPLLMITPQGKFVDPRLPIEVRPGIGLVCSQSPGVRVICGAVEYAFWNEQRPEVFLRAVEVECPADHASARAWTDAVQAAMNANSAALAALVQARDGAAFETLSGGGRARIHPLYDAFLRLTGRGTSVDTEHRRAVGTASRGERGAPGDCAPGGSAPGALR